VFKAAAPGGAGLPTRDVSGATKDMAPLTTGGILFARDLLHGTGYVSVAVIALALIMVTLMKPRQTAAQSA